MVKFNLLFFVTIGSALLLFGAHPAARAQTTPDATPPAATTPDAAAPATPGTATTPPNAAPANPVPAPAEQPTVVHEKPRFRFGPAIGVYLPASGKTRSRFGDTWYSIGVGLGALNSVRTNGVLGIDANLFYHGRGSDHAFFLPIGIGYRIALTPGTSAVPYVGVSVDANVSDITSNEENVHNSFQVGGGGSAFVGVNFGDSAFVEARYLELSHANGFDLSGLSLSGGYRF